MKLLIIIRIQTRQEVEMKNIIGMVFIKYQNSTFKIAQQALKKYYKRNDPLQGFCNKQSTQKFSKIQSSVHQNHWRTPRYLAQQIKLSSLGIGSQGGQPNEESDIKMFEVMYEGIKTGKINVIDTDVNFRFGKSEKTINAVLNYLKDEGVSRSSIFVATKCGYILNDIDSNLDQKQFTKILVDDGHITKDQIVNEIHCIHPNFIEFSVQKSLLSLGLETIDLLYLNNPTEGQQTVIGKQQYFNRLEKAFECLQILRSKNKIRYYGIASFISLRSPPNEDGIHVQLSQIMNLAKKVGGDSHGLKFILVPFNLGMPQILMKWQKSNSTQEHIFKIAEQFKVNINICCPLFQGRVANLPFKSQILKNIKNNSAKHLQLVRSIPKQPVLSTIFSTLNIQHLRQNIQVVNHPYLTEQEWKNVLPV